ncbi:HEAT repeat domain-containing protein [Planctomycetota bacterium]
MRKGICIGALAVVVLAAIAWRLTLTPEYLCLTGDAKTKRDVILFLKHKAPWRARRLLAGLVHDPDLKVRISAIACIRVLDLKELSPIVSALARRDDQVLVRAQAIESLAVLDPADAAPVVLAGLDDTEPNIRIGSLLAVKRGVEAPREKLIAMLKDGDSRVREAALEVAVHLRLEEAVPILKEDMETQELFDVVQALEALQKLTGASPVLEKGD